MAERNVTVAIQSGNGEGVFVVVVSEHVSLNSQNP